MSILAALDDETYYCSEDDNEDDYDAEDEIVRIIRKKEELVG